MLGLTAVRRYLAVMAAHGYPEEHLLQEAGLGALHPVGTGRALIAPNEYRRLIRTILDVSGRSGLDLAQTAFHDLGDLGAVGHASAASATVRNTWRVWSRFGPTLVGMMGRMQIGDEDARSITLTISDPDPLDPLYRFSVEELLTMERKVSRMPLAGHPSVFELALSYPAPKDADRYSMLFGCPLRFNARQTRIRVWKSWFDELSKPHDEEFHAICIRHCESVLNRIEAGAPTRAELNRLFTTFKNEPLPRLESAAKRLNLSTRTLRRRLSDEGTSYREELDRFRAESAKHYLANTQLATKEIAFLLGFGMQSAFRNAFKSWTGMTAGEFRRRANSDPSSRTSNDLH